MHIFPNGKKYIGITSQSVERRWRASGEGYNQQSLITHAIRKYGWDNIEHKIIAKVSSQEEAEEMEKSLISELMTNNRKYGYNVEAGGHCAKGHKLSESTRLKMSISRTGEKNWNYGRHLPEEVKKKLSIAHKGKKHSAEAIRKSVEKRMCSKAYNARKVICYDMDYQKISEYGSLAEGSRDQGVRIQDVYLCCIGRQKSTHGRRWAYAE